MEIPDIKARCRITGHLRCMTSAVEVKHLWSGYLAALLEWELIGQREYVALSRLISGIRTDELYYLFADEPIPVESESLAVCHA